jgi:hypothetical protein
VLLWLHFDATSGTYSTPPLIPPLIPFFSPSPQHASADYYQGLLLTNKDSNLFQIGDPLMSANLVLPFYQDYDTRCTAFLQIAFSYGVLNGLAANSFGIAYNQTVTNLQQLPPVAAKMASLSLKTSDMGGVFVVYSIFAGTAVVVFIWHWFTSRFVKVDLKGLGESLPSPASIHGSIKRRMSGKVPLDTSGATDPQGTISNPNSASDLTHWDHIPVPTAGPSEWEEWRAPHPLPPIVLAPREPSYFDLGALTLDSILPTFLSPASPTGTGAPMADDRLPPGAGRLAHEGGAGAGTNQPGTTFVKARYGKSSDNLLETAF